MTARLVARLSRREVAAAPARTALVAAVLVLGTVLSALAGAALVPAISAEPTGDTFLRLILGITAVLSLAVTLAVIVPINIASLRRRRRDLERLDAQGARRTTLVGVALGPGLLVTVPAVTLGAALAWLTAPRVLNSFTWQPDPHEGALLTWGIVAGAGVVAIASIGSDLLPAAVTVGALPRAGTQPTTATGARRTDAALALATLLLGGTGLRLATVGASRIVPALATIGVALVLSAAAPALALLLRAAFRLRAGPFELLFALRDAARHLLRVAPPAIAGAAVVAGVVVAMTYAGTTAAAAAESHRPIAPPGAALAVGRTVDDVGTIAPVDLNVIRAGVAGAGVGAVADVIPVSVGQGPWLSVRDPHGAPRPLGALDGGLFWDKPLVLVPGEPNAYGLGDDVLEAVNSGKLAVPIDYAALVELGNGTIDVHTGGDPFVSVPAAAVVRAGAPSPVVMSPEVARGLGMTVTQAFAIVVLDRPLTIDDERAFNDAGLRLMVEVGPQGGHPDSTQLGLLVGGGTGLVVVIVAIAALSRGEARNEGATLAAVGAETGFLRRVAFVQGGVAGLAACVIGCAAGLIIARVLLASRDSAYAGRYTAGGVAVLDVPWPVLGALAVLLPLAVAGVSAAISPVSRECR